MLKVVRPVYEDEGVVAGFCDVTEIVLAAFVNQQQQQQEEEEQEEGQQEQQQLWEQQQQEQEKQVEAQQGQHQLQWQEQQKGQEELGRPQQQQQEEEDGAPVQQQDPWHNQQQQQQQHSSISSRVLSLSVAVDAVLCAATMPSHVPPSSPWCPSHSESLVVTQCHSPVSSWSPLQQLLLCQKLMAPFHAAASMDAAKATAAAAAVAEASASATSAAVKGERGGGLDSAGPENFLVGLLQQSLGSAAAAAGDGGGGSGGDTTAGLEVEDERISEAATAAAAALSLVSLAPPPPAAAASAADFATAAEAAFSSEPQRAPPPLPEAAAVTQRRGRRRTKQPGGSIPLSQKLAGCSRALATACDDPATAPLLLLTADQAKVLQLVLAQDQNIEQMMVQLSRIVGVGGDSTRGDDSRSRGSGLGEEVGVADGGKLAGRWGMEDDTTTTTTTSSSSSSRRRRRRSGSLAAVGRGVIGGVVVMGEEAGEEQQGNTSSSRSSGRGDSSATAAAGVLGPQSAQGTSADTKGWEKMQETADREEREVGHGERGLGGGSRAGAEGLGMYLVLQGVVGVGRDGHVWVAKDRVLQLWPGGGGGGLLLLEDVVSVTEEVREEWLGMGGKEEEDQGGGLGGQQQQKEQQEEGAPFMGLEERQQKEQQQEQQERLLWFPQGSDVWGLVLVPRVCEVLCVHPDAGVREMVGEAGLGKIQQQLTQVRGGGRGWRVGEGPEGRRLGSKDGGDRGRREMVREGARLVEI